MQNPMRALALAAVLSAAPASVGLATLSAGELRSIVPLNPAAVIPPQCFTRTLDAAGGTHNPCSTCHQGSAEPNYADDGDLQLAYDFPERLTENPWTNLFIDRRPAIAAISDVSILSYVRQDNYRGADGGIALRARLAVPPAEWDFDGDGGWTGYRPDIWFDFDAEGYDHAPDGARTGWRAYSYVPLPGAFWPTNGSFDDVAIRLPEAFRQSEGGGLDWSVYAVNLAIVEALAKRTDVAIAPTNERRLGVDLDRDGALGIADHVAFAFDPRNGVTMRYAGRAGDLLDAGAVHLAAGLFPEGTEFVHTVRYLDVAADGTVRPAARLKELRYAVKQVWLTYYNLQEMAQNEIREGSDYPDRYRQVFGDIEAGVSNGQGWVYRGFIEAADGSLRPQTLEESMTCAGCHSGIGATTDSAFSYPRKIDAPAPADGWIPWGSRGMAFYSDSQSRAGLAEYVAYLDRNGAGDEFRANAEIGERFFTPQGHLQADAGARLATDIGSLLLPSPARALELDKAYRLIVEEQSYRLGRAPVVAPLDATVHRTIAPGEPTGITEVAR